MLGMGDIWSTGAFSFESPLKDLLDSGDYSVEQLLAEDELLQELRGVHTELIAYLSTPEAATKLIYYVIAPTRNQNNNQTTTTATTTATENEEEEEAAAVASSTSSVVDAITAIRTLESEQGQGVDETNTQKEQDQQQATATTTTETTTETVQAVSKEPGEWLRQQLEQVQKQSTETTTSASGKTKNPENDPDMRYIRFPYMACEVICCEIQDIIDVILDHPVETLNPDILNLLEKAGYDMTPFTTTTTTTSNEDLASTAAETSTTVTMTTATTSSTMARTTATPTEEDDEQGETGVGVELQVAPKPKILDLFFSVLYATPEGQLDDYRAGYFDKVLTVLFRKRTDDMTEYMNRGGNIPGRFRQNKNAATTDDDDDGDNDPTPLMKAMFRHLNAHSMMQLTQRLLLPMRPTPPSNAAQGAAKAAPLIADPEAVAADGEPAATEILPGDNDEEDDPFAGMDAAAAGMIRCDWSKSSKALDFLLDLLIGPHILPDSELEKERILDASLHASEVLITMIQNSMLTSDTMMKLTSSPVLKRIMDAATTIRSRPRSQVNKNEEEEEYLPPGESLLTASMNVLESIILQLGGYGAIGTMSLIQTDGTTTTANDNSDQPPPPPPVTGRRRAGPDDGDSEPPLPGSAQPHRHHHHRAASEDDDGSQPIPPPRRRENPFEARNEGIEQVIAGAKEEKQQQQQQQENAPTASPSSQEAAAAASPPVPTPIAKETPTETNTPVSVEQTGETGTEDVELTLAGPPQIMADLTNFLQLLPQLLSRLAHLLRHPSTKRWKSPMQYANREAQPILGTCRLRMVRLLESLVLVGDVGVDACLIQSECLGIVLDLFWEFQWCSMLHQSVANLLVHIFEGQNARGEMQEFFLLRCDLMARLMTSFARESKAGAALAGQKPFIEGMEEDDGMLVNTIESDGNMRETPAQTDLDPIPALTDEDKESSEEIVVSEDDVDAAMEKQVAESLPSDEDDLGEEDVGSGLQKTASADEDTEQDREDEANVESMEHGPSTDPNQPDDSNPDTNQDANDVASLGADAIAVPSPPPQSFRSGYMGHVIIICQALVHACSVGMEQTLQQQQEQLEQQQQQDEASNKDVEDGGTVPTMNGGVEAEGRELPEGGPIEDSQANSGVRPETSKLVNLVLLHPLADRWNQFVATTLATETAIQSTPLGGYSAPVAIPDPLHAHRPGPDDGDTGDDDLGPPAPPRGRGMGDVGLTDQDMDMAAAMIAGMNLGRPGAPGVPEEDQSGGSGDSDETNNSGGYAFDDPLGKTSGLGLELGKLSQYRGPGSKKSSVAAEEEDDEDDDDSSSDEEPDSRQSSREVPVMNLFAGNFDEQPPLDGGATMPAGGEWANFADFSAAAPTDPASDDWSDFASFEDSKVPAQTSTSAANDDFGPFSSSIAPTPTATGGDLQGAKSENPFEGTEEDLFASGGATTGNPFDDFTTEVKTPVIDPFAEPDSNVADPFTEPDSKVVDPFADPDLKVVDPFADPESAKESTKNPFDEFVSSKPIGVEKSDPAKPNAETEAKIDPFDISSASPESPFGDFVSATSTGPEDAVTATDSVKSKEPETPLFSEAVEAQTESTTSPEADTVPSEDIGEKSDQKAEVQSGEKDRGGQEPSAEEAEKEETKTEGDGSIPSDADEAGKEERTNAKADDGIQKTAVSTDDGGAIEVSGVSSVDDPTSEVTMNGNKTDFATD